MKPLITSETSRPRFASRNVTEVKPVNLRPLPQTPININSRPLPQTSNTGAKPQTTRVASPKTSTFRPQSPKIAVSKNAVPIPFPKSETTSPKVTTEKIVRSPPSSRPASPKIRAPKSPKTKQRESEKIIILAKPNNRIPTMNRFRGGKHVILYPSQVAWGQRVLDIVDNNYGYFDLSSPGSGKTIILIMVAQYFNFPILVICPVTVAPMWQEVGIEYGVNIIIIISYEATGATKGNQPSHGFLHRVENPINPKNMEFFVTEEYMALVKSGIILVFDEVHKIKNDNSYYKACAELLRPIYSGIGDNKSRFAILTGTLYDNPTRGHAKNILKLTGYMIQEEMFLRSPLRLTGLNDVIEHCEEFNPELTDELVSGFLSKKVTKKEALMLCHRLFTRIIKQQVGGSMPVSPDTIKYLRIYNGFYQIHPERRAELLDAVRSLELATKYVADKNDPNVKQLYDDLDAESSGEAITLGTMTTALLNIEMSKAYDMARIARNILISDPNAKVIICFNYRDPLNEAAELLADFEPMIMTGATPVKKRKEIQDWFNFTTDANLILANTGVINLGINLHDTVGDKPRTMIISPSPRLFDIIQASRRIARQGTRSIAEVIMFYSVGGGKLESDILNNLIQKSAYFEETIPDEAAEQMLLPKDYEAVYERSYVQL